jgi:hypothetical protein
MEVNVVMSEDLGLTNGFNQATYCDMEPDDGPAIDTRNSKFNARKHNTTTAASNKSFNFN